jgi:hypothetical protein
MVYQLRPPAPSPPVGDPAFAPRFFLCGDKVASNALHPNDFAVAPDLAFAFAFAFAFVFVFALACALALAFAFALALEVSS